MTKEEIETVIKRYPYITKAIRRQQSEAAFYIGNRKFVIPITDEVKTVCNLAEMVFEKEKNEIIKRIIRDIMLGKSDVFIMSKIPYSRNGYYSKKQAIVAKIYKCCISRGLVTLDDVLDEEIA